MVLMKSTTACKNHRYVRVLKMMLWCMVLALPLSALSQEAPPIPLQKITAPLIDLDSNGERYFGDLLVKYTVDPTGKIVVCTLYLSTVVVGISSLAATSPVYQFDVKAGASAASGSLSLYLNHLPLISTLKADFTYTVKDNNTCFPYKGDLVGWYISD